MSFLTMFNKNTPASKAVSRLNIILSHERSINIPYLEEMKRDIEDVIRKYTRSKEISFKSDSNQGISILEIEIKLDE